MIDYLGNWNLSWSMSREETECNWSITRNMWCGLSWSKFIEKFSKINNFRHFFFQTNLEQFSEVAVNLLAHKTPIVRQCTQQFLTKCFSMATQMTLSKKILKIYLTALIKVCSIWINNNKKIKFCWLILEYRRSWFNCTW